MTGWRRVVLALGVLVIACFLAALTTRPALADGSVSSLRMGMGAVDAAAFRRFMDVIQQFNASGERFRIDSHCQSACTMFLSIRNVCVSPGATLLFHAGGSRRNGISSTATQQMLGTYNAALRQYVTEHHFMDTFEFHSISGRDIVARFGYPACR